MKSTIALIIVLLLSFRVFAVEYNTMVIDSSFPPLERDGFSIGKKSCILINENNLDIPLNGKCFNEKEWNDVREADVDLLKGILDHFSKKNTAYSKKWKEFNKINPKQARKVLNSFILSSHGTRSSYLIYKHSDKLANILPLRVVTTQAGTTKQKKISSGKTKIIEKYKDGCSLINWTGQQKSKFKQGNLQPYQQRIKKALDENKKIKIINISLGYKRSWIGEDNPKCTKEQVYKEFEILQSTWKNLISLFPKRLFFVAGGNENQNFDNPLYGKDDLWSSLSTLPNLIIVGSTTVQGFKYRTSNFGENVDIMALGEKISVFSPVPLSKSGYATTLRGTSFSTPQVAGITLRLWGKDKSLKQVKLELISRFQSSRQKKVIESYKTYCSDITKNSDNCLHSIITLLRNDFIWDNLSQYFKRGKKAWSFKPFPIYFKKELGTLAKLKLDIYKGEYIPHLYLKPTNSPLDLLITLNHEMYHYAKIANAAKYFKSSKKIKNCTTQYKLELLKDEEGAFLSEINFWKLAPGWFKSSLGKKKFDSKLLEGKYNYKNYYKKLKDKINKTPNFIFQRYIELGEYPKCVLKLI